MYKNLSGADRKELLEAIIDAYPEKPQLKMMVSFELDENLATIVGGDVSLRETVFELIQWAESTGRIKELIEKAHQYIPGNLRLKASRDRLIPIKFSDNISFSQNSPIPSEDWYNLRDILNDIDFDILTQICQTTLEKIVKNQDVLGNYPEIVNLKDRDIIKTIFLKKCTSNDRGLPAIVEFAERLSNEKPVKPFIRENLEQWVRDIAQKLSIRLPSYPSTVTEISNVCPYLLITVTPQSNNTSLLKAELITEYNDARGQNLGESLCSFEKIIDEVDEFINKSTRYLKRYQYEDLTIELFLPMKYLKESLDLEKISMDDEEDRQPIGKEYRFILRSLERFTHKKDIYRTRLLRKWKVLTDFMQNSSVEKIETRFEHMNCMEKWTWDELEYHLSLQQEKIGLKITCGLPSTPEEVKELFKTILKAGIPVSLWTRSNNISGIEEEFRELLSVKVGEDLSELFKSVHKIRKKAHAKTDKAMNYLGYHLGILCDDPNRLPFHLKPENQQFLEPGL